MFCCSSKESQRKLYMFNKLQKERNRHTQLDWNHLVVSHMTVGTPPSLTGLLSETKVKKKETKLNILIQWINNSYNTIPLKLNSHSYSNVLFTICSPLVVTVSKKELTQNVFNRWQLIIILTSCKHWHNDMYVLQINSKITKQSFS